VQFSKTELKPQIEEPQPHQAGNTLLSTLGCAEGQKTKTVQLSQNSKPVSQTPETTLPQNKGVVEGYPHHIHTTDYKPLECLNPMFPALRAGR